MKVLVDNDIRGCIRPHTPRERSLLRAKLKREKLREKLLYFKDADGMCWQLEGHTRRDLCAELDLKIEWHDMSDLVHNKDEAIEWVIDHHEARRNQTAEEISQARAKRVESVKARRAEGQTTRAIADAEGISQTQVLRDLADSVEPGGSTEILPQDREEMPEANGTPAPKVTGRDGKRYSSRKRKPRGDAAPEGAKSDADESQEEIKDMTGRVVPDNCQEPFRALAHFTEAESLCRKLDKLLHEIAEMPGGANLARCLRATQDKEGETRFRCDELKAIRQHLRWTKPYAVCTDCDGKAPKSCKGCSGRGWMEERTYKAEAKA